MREWTKYEVNETPPKIYECPFHEGHTIPCNICIEWVNFDPDEKGE